MGEAKGTTQRCRQPRSNPASFQGSATVNAGKSGRPPPSQKSLPQLTVLNKIWESIPSPTSACARMNSVCQLYGNTQYAKQSLHIPSLSTFDPRGIGFSISRVDE